MKSSIVGVVTPLEDGTFHFCPFWVEESSEGFEIESMEKLFSYLEKLKEPRFLDWIEKGVTIQAVFEDPDSPDGVRNEKVEFVRPS